MGRGKDRNGYGKLAPVDTKADVSETKKCATLLAEAMDRLEALFVATARALVGSGPAIDYEDWDAQIQAAVVLRERAGAIGDDLESSVPQRKFDSPKFRRSRVFPFYVTSRNGLRRQFSAVDIIRVALRLLWVAQDDGDAELAGKTAEAANALGQHALLLLQAAPTLGLDSASLDKMRVLTSALDNSYDEAKRLHQEALAAFDRIVGD